MKKLLLLLFSAVIFFSLASPVFAQTSNKLTRCSERVTVGGTAYNVVTISCVPVLFANIIYWLILLSGTVAVFFVIFGGIKLLTSGGDQKNVEAARKTITWAIIGLVVVLISFGVVTIVAQTTGVGCISRFGFDSCDAERQTSCEPRGASCGGSTRCCSPSSCRNTASASQMPDYRCQ